MELAEKFKQGVELHTYQRIDSKYKVNIFLGYNDDGQMSMVITERGSVTRLKSSKLINTQMLNRDDGKTALSFDLVDKSYISTFLVFCKDIIAVCEKAGKDAAIANAVIRWKYWLELFGKKKLDILEKSEIKGLIGELLVLRDYLIPQCGVAKAIASWMGPLSGHKDFEIDDTWYEVKAVNESALQVSISSLEQLEDERIGHLVVVRLEDSNDAVSQTLTLNQVVASLVDLIEDPDDLDLFRHKLVAIGYDFNDQYDKFHFALKGIQKYRVDDGFPRIRRNDVHLAVGNVKYTILIDGIVSFQED